MATAVHVPRASPTRLQNHLHPALVPPPSLAMTHPPPLPPTSRLHFPPPLELASQGLPPSLPFHPHTLPLPPPLTLPSPFGAEGMGEEEDVDEDDMSDLEEEELHKELLAYRSRRLEPDMTRQLLAFADRLSSDIHKFFGRRKDDEDSCDVYEDKWTVTKSGRELYYADLIRIAQGDFSDARSSSSKVSEAFSSSSSASALRAEAVPEDNRHSFSGKADASRGLGPLEELFNHARQTGRHRKGAPSMHAPVSATSSASRRPGRGEGEAGLGMAKALPMHQRSFPESFWLEPAPGGGGVQGTGMDLPGVPSSVVQSLGSSKLPDFSDLMDSWHGDHSQLQQQHQQQIQQQQHLHQQQLHTLQPPPHLHAQRRHSHSHVSQATVDVRKRRL